MDEANISLKAYEKLHQSIPSIGFLSRKKRILAYLTITKLAQEMIDNEELSEENALFLLSVLVRKSADFQKSATMVALNLPTLDRKIMTALAFKYANEIRCNLKMMPAEDDVPLNL